MTKELKEKVNQIKRLSDIFSPYLVTGEDYMKFDRSFNNIYLMENAPEEAKKAYDEYLAILKKQDDEYRIELSDSDDREEIRS